MDDHQARELVARIDALLDEVHDVELVQALVDLYGEGLARIVAYDPACIAGVADDELVSHLLLLHGLHPVPLEQRVRGALDDVRPYLEQHGGDVELLGVEGGIARLRLEGSCNGCPSSTATLETRDRGRDPAGRSGRRGDPGRGGGGALLGPAPDRDRLPAGAP